MILPLESEFKFPKAITLLPTTTLTWTEDDFGNEEIEILKIISRLPEFSWMPQANPEKVRAEIHSKIGDILHQYYIENTQNSSGVWTSKFKNHGISENDGKTMIACARRLGLDIS